MKRKLKWLAVVLVVLLVGFAIVLFLGPRDRVTEDSWSQIRIGMTVEQVETILGFPGLDWEEHQAKKAKRSRTFVMEGRYLLEPRWIETEGLKRKRREGEVKHWAGRRGDIAVFLDERGHVRGKRFSGWRAEDEDDLLNRLLILLGR